jgi:hypothetical protein
VVTTDLTPIIHFMDPITDEERRQEAETEALVRKISLEDPEYWNRLVARVSEEAKPENGGVTMEEFLGMPPAEESQ